MTAHGRHDIVDCRLGNIMYRYTVAPHLILYTENRTSRGITVEILDGTQTDMHCIYFPFNESSCCNEMCTQN